MHSLTAAYFRFNKNSGTQDFLDKEEILCYALIYFDMGNFSLIICGFARRRMALKLLKL